MDQNAERQGRKNGTSKEAPFPPPSPDAAAAPSKPAAASEAAPPPAAKRRERVAVENRGPDGVNTFPAITQSYDRLIHAIQGRITHGVSPASMTLAYLDWLVNLANSPGKMTELQRNAFTKSARFALYALNAAFRHDAVAPFISPLPQDSRFSSDAWKHYPFNIYYQAFLLAEQWWNYATVDVRGTSRHHQEVVNFCARQFLDMISPSNFPMTNPDVIKATQEQGGSNISRGFEKFTKDFENILAAKPTKTKGEFKVGVNIACTPGKVIYRNRLIELIQYTPTTEKVHPEPVLIVPAWIMKYYILDLSPHNSLVRYLLSQGYTVFMISWRNPGPAERNVGMEDYLNLGVRASLGVISQICPKTKIHAAGYCLGGTLLSIGAATMARENNEILKSVTLFAAQTDFEEAGEIMLFIDDCQVTFLEDMMWDQGYLDTTQMSGAFQMLRSNDMIWSKMLHEYVLGEDDRLSDLMSWNADATRMPARMHSEYLRDLFLHNDLSRGRYLVGGRPVSLTDIHTPVCAVGTSKDHIAPWKSVYKVTLMADADVTFILASGGHNTGIVNPPGKARGYYQINTHRTQERYIDPDTWTAIMPHQEGSWWPAWVEWLNSNSEPADAAPPPLGTKSYPAIEDAPGEYVLIT